MQQVSAGFESKRKAESYPIHKEYMLTQNYASSKMFGTIISASAQDSGYEAVYAIDGDRTHLNHYWQGNIGSGVTLDLIFAGYTRRIGLVKLFSHPDASVGYNSNFKLQYLKESQWIDITPTRIWGMNKNNNPIPKISNSIEYIRVTTNNDIRITTDLDTRVVKTIFPAMKTNTSLTYIMFDEIQTNRLQLMIYESTAGTKARLCEIEVYRCIDITEYFYNQIQIARRMDATWNKFQGGTFQMHLHNNDRRFSPGYTPTSEETADGFFNNELQPGNQILFFGGFYNGSDNEYVQFMEGYVDNITVNGSERTTTISGRDKYKLLSILKQVINQSNVATKSIENCIEYVCNKANISSSELNLSSSNIELDWFAVKDKTAAEIIYSLTQAMGNASLVINENGQVQARYSNNNRSWIQTTQKDWLAGIFTNCDGTTVPGAVYTKLGSNIKNNDFENDLTDGWEKDGDCNRDNASGAAYHGTWYVWILYQINPKFQIFTKDNVLINSWDITKYQSTWTANNIDLSAYSGQNIKFGFTDTHGSIRTKESYFCNGGTFLFYSKYYSYMQEAYTFIDYCMGGIATTANYLSQKNNCGQVSAWGRLEAKVNIPSGSSLVFKTQTSPTGLDGSWDTETELTGIVSDQYTISGQIENVNPSSNPYIRWKAYFGNTGEALDMQINEVVIRWTAGGGDTLPTSENFTFACEGQGYNEDGNLQSISGTKSDTIGDISALAGKVYVKAKPLFKDAATSLVWDNKSFSVENGNYDFWADLSDPCEKDVTMDLVVSDGVNTKHYFGDDTSSGTLPTFISSVIVTWSNVKPRIQMTCSGTGTITVFKIDAKAYRERGTIEQLAQVEDYDLFKQQYGDNPINISNDFIQRNEQARLVAEGVLDKVSSLKSRAGKCKICFTPNIQIYDRVRIVDWFLGINQNNYYVVGITQTIQTGKSTTLLELQEI